MGNNIWRATGFYGFPESSRRRDSWELLHRLHSLSPIPWCYIGGFNVSLAEKLQRMMNSFWWGSKANGINSKYLLDELGKTDSGGISLHAEQILI